MGLPSSASPPEEPRWIRTRPPDVAPSPHRQYSDFLTTTGDSVPGPRIGTQVFVRSPLERLPSHRDDWFPPCHREAWTRRTPPARRTPARIPLTLHLTTRIRSASEWLGDRLHWSPAPHSPVERGEALPEQGRRRAFPRLPLIDDGLPCRAHQCGQLRLAQAARATQRANLLSVVLGHIGPGQGRATIIWADHPPIVRPPKRPGGGGSRAGSEVAKGGPCVIGHWQPAVPGRRPQRFDVHADEPREHG